MRVQVLHTAGVPHHDTLAVSVLCPVAHSSWSARSPWPLLGLPDQGQGAESLGLGGPVLHAQAPRAAPVPEPKAESGGEEKPTPWDVT